MKCAAYIDPKTGIALEGEALATASKNSDSPRCGYDLAEDDMFCPRCGIGVNEIKSINIRQTSWWTFDGRATRKKYWITTLKISGVMMGVIVLSVVLTAVLIKAGVDTGVVQVLPLLGGIIGVISSFSLIPVSVRRLHDVDYSGLILLLGFIPIIGLAVNLYLFAVMGFRRGTNGPNKYGPDPLA